MRLSGLAAAVGAAVLAFAAPHAARAAEMTPAQRGEAYAKLPQWPGVWRANSTLFDLSRGMRNPNGDLNVRDFPPYKPEWEARYNSFLERVVKTGQFSDPLTLCFPSGMPRLASSARGFQVVISPDMVWIIYERPDVRYIHMDGRKHPSPDVANPTWNGHSVGHWEGDTLVVDTANLKGGVPIDRTGLVLSGSATINERIRRVDENTLEDILTITDPEAFTKPWVVTRVYKRDALPLHDLDYVSCMENNRNAVVNGETQMLLRNDPRRIPSTENYPADLKKFAVP